MDGESTSRGVAAVPLVGGIYRCVVCVGAAFQRPVFLPLHNPILYSYLS